MINIEDLAKKIGLTSEEVRQAISELSGIDYQGSGAISNNLSGRVQKFIKQKKEEKETDKNSTVATVADEETAPPPKKPENIKKKIILKKKIVLKKKTKKKVVEKNDDKPTGAKKSGDEDAAKKTPPKKTDSTAKDKDKSSWKKGKDLHHSKDREFGKKRFEERQIHLHRKKDSQSYKNRESFEIQITENISVGELAKKMNVKVQQVIKKLMDLGVMASITQQVDSETAVIVAEEFNCTVKVISLYEETLIEEKKDNESDLMPRPPVVTIMGHVDHGKTQLLDTIRKANVVAGEAGGITQHIGAYKITLPNKKEITFIDTPGHAAFTAMRARGASVTDVVVLIVAADDGVMPQTVEALNHARAAKVPIIVAVNKMDLPAADLDNVKSGLARHNLNAEDWGGDVQFIPISALKGDGVDQLLEAILLETEMMELKGNPKASVVGTIIESRIDPGRGAVATVLIQKGTLKVGSTFVAGIYSGKVRALLNDQGERIESATVSDPVEIIGLDGVPESGDPFQGVDDEKFAKKISQKRVELKKHESAQNVSRVTLDNLFDKIKEGEVQDFNVIIKSDVHGSTEALKDSLSKIQNAEVRVNVLHAETGAINERDVLLASTTNAIIVGFHIRPNKKALEMATKEHVEIRTYSVIYKCTEDIEAAIHGLLKPEFREQVTGRAQIKQIFKISRLGNIAGAIVTTGVIRRNANIRVLRESAVIHDGKLSSLKRFNDDTKEVKEGFECGFQIENYNDIREGDEIESYEMQEVARESKPSEA